MLCGGTGKRTVLVLKRVQQRRCATCQNPGADPAGSLCARPADEAMAPPTAALSLMRPSRSWPPMLHSLSFPSTQHIMNVVAAHKGAGVCKRAFLERYCSQLP